MRYQETVLNNSNISVFRRNKKFLVKRTNFRTVQEKQHQERAKDELLNELLR